MKIGRPTIIGKAFATTIQDQKVAATAVPGLLYGLCFEATR